MRHRFITRSTLILGALLALAVFARPDSALAQGRGHGRGHGHGAKGLPPGQAKKFFHDKKGRTVVLVAPPAVRAERVPALPFAGAIWLPGYWSWQPAGYVWVPGRHVKPRAGYVYRPGAWVALSGGWVWQGGGWRAR